MNGKLKVIMAVHPNGDNTEYMFEVPIGMDVHRGNILLVDTMRGNSIAICSTEPIEIDYNDISTFGAYLPLKKIIQCAGEQMQKYIYDRCRKELKDKIKYCLQDEIEF